MGNPIEDALNRPLTPLYPQAPSAPHDPALGAPTPAPARRLTGPNPFGTRSQTTYLQSKLRAAGYNVGIDGIAGPQTLSAYEAYLHKVPPNAWGEAYSRNHRPAAHPAPHASAPPPVAHGAPPIPVPPPAPGRVPASIAPRTAAPSPPGLIDPRAFAQSAANEEYNPQIAELARQIADAKRQENTTQGNIQDWYAKLVGDAGAAAKANSTDAATILGGHDAAAAGLVNALGGSSSGAAADAGANATIGRTALEGLGLTNAAFARNLGTAYAGEGVTALGDQHRAYASDLKNALAKSTDLQGAKGAAYNTALQNALVQRTAQEKQAMDTKVEAKLSGVQEQQAEANLANTKLQTKIDNWRFQAGIKAANAGGDGAVPDFTKQNPGDLSRLAANLQDGLIGPKGNLTVDPLEAYNRLGDRLRQISYGKWNPKSDEAVNKWRNRVVLDHLPAWNRQHPNGPHFAFSGGSIHRTK